MLLSFVIQLVWFAILLPFRLLPLAVKYAPLALFFVEGTPQTPLYLAMAERAVLEDVTSDAPVTCFQFSLTQDAVEGLKKARSRSSRLLLLEKNREVPREELAEIWQVLRKRRGTLRAEEGLARQVLKDHRGSARRPLRKNP